MKGFWKEHWNGALGITLTIIFGCLALYPQLRGNFIMPQLIKDYYPIMLFFVLYFPIQYCVICIIARRNIQKSNDEEVSKKARRIAKEVHLKEYYDSKAKSNYVWEYFDLPGKFPYPYKQKEPSKILLSLARDKDRFEEDFRNNNIQLQSLRCFKCRGEIYFTASPDTKEEGMHCHDCRKPITTISFNLYIAQAEKRFKAEMEKILEEYEEEKKREKKDKTT